MIDLTLDQQEVGKQNFLTALGSLRRDFLTKSLTAPAVGPYYFGYKPIDKPIKAAIVGTGDEGCQAMIEQSPPHALEFVAYHDVRPSQIERGRKSFRKIYGKEKGDAVKFYDKWDDMLADKDVEAVVIATPLWTHARFAVQAMKAGKHVLCEKLMARYI
ncbi:MAG: Gfo/Idh/MocA family protein, partial [Planctomycetia bacterium]